MNLLPLYLMLIFLCACGGKSRSNSHSQSHPKSTSSSSSAPLTSQPEIVVEQPSLGPHEVPKTFHLQFLIKKGIHILGQSNLIQLGNPPVIYCSNTRFTNQEKIEELEKLKDFTDDDMIEVLTVDNMKISKELLLDLIEKSILTLSVEPYSTICPQIYLSLN